MILSDTIPLLLNKGHDQTIKLIFSNPDDHLENILRLSTICKVKIKFKNPVSIRLNMRKFKKDVTEHIFNGFFRSKGQLCYRFKSGGRSGMFLPDEIESYEPVLKTLNNFENYEQFRAKFDTFFITEDFIKTLWIEKSSQTDARYAPSDFKSISRSGKEALTQFLRRFQGVDCKDTEHYTKTTFNGGEPYYVMRAYKNGTGGSSTSRDISISHQIGHNKVYYSSEYHNCGNGRYGIIANKSTYLWLEDD